MAISGLRARIQALPADAVLGLDTSRAEERQRQLRLRLPRNATCWHYAPLVDVTFREPSGPRVRFTGCTAADWIRYLEDATPTACKRFKIWYERAASRQMTVLAALRRTPLNQYCTPAAHAPLLPSLPSMVRALSLRQASADQWIATLRGLTTKGLKSEELEESGVLDRLARLPSMARPSQAQVLGMIDLSHVIPKLVVESRFAFSPQSGWQECCQRLRRQHKEHRGSGSAMTVVRYQHKSLGWKIARTLLRDLFGTQREWWSVLDERQQLVPQPRERFTSPEEAIRFAEVRMSQRFAEWGKDHAISRWDDYALPGGDEYRELLVQIDDWPETYVPRHFRIRNVLIHLRTTIRVSNDGRRLLYLDEVQSDWHADIHKARAGSCSTATRTPVPDAPFRREWPLLALKLMLWWGQRIAASGVAFSTADLQEARWSAYSPPTLLYDALLPSAAKSLSKTLGISYDTAQIAVRSGDRTVEQTGDGWSVCDRDDTPLTKAFNTKAQAERFADLTSRVHSALVPVLWLGDLPPLRWIPLYGTGARDDWFSIDRQPSKNRDFVLDPFQQRIAA